MKKTFAKSHHLSSWDQQKIIKRVWLSVGLTLEKWRFALYILLSPPPLFNQLNVRNQSSQRCCLSIYINHEMIQLRVLLPATWTCYSFCNVNFDLPVIVSIGWDKQQTEVGGTQLCLSVFDSFQVSSLEYFSRLKNACDAVCIIVDMNPNRSCHFIPICRSQHL